MSQPPASLASPTQQARSAGTSRFVWSAVVVLNLAPGVLLLAIALFALTGCGGGGGGSSDSGNVSYGYTAKLGLTLDVSYTASNPESVTGVTLNDPFPQASPSNQDWLSKYPLNNGNQVFNVDTSAATGSNSVNLGNSNKLTVKVGGVDRKYARFGLMETRGDSASSYTAKAITYTRFIRYRNATLAAYDSYTGKAVGKFVVQDAWQYHVECSTSAGFKPQGQLQTVNLTLSDCKLTSVQPGGTFQVVIGKPIGGSVSVQLDKESPDALSLSKTPTIASNDINVDRNALQIGTTGTNAPTGIFNVAGPNGEDIVGELRLRGPLNTGTAEKTATLILAFGAFR